MDRPAANQLRVAQKMRTRSARRTTHTGRNGLQVIGADFWRNLHKEFEDLAHEECAALPDPAHNRRLRAYGMYAKGSAIASWSLNEGLSENFLRRFEDAATRAGGRPGDTFGREPPRFLVAT